MSNTIINVVTGWNFVNLNLIFNRPQALPGQDQELVNWVEVKNVKCYCIFDNLIRCFMDTFNHKTQWPSTLRIHGDRKGHGKPSGKIRIWCCFEKIEFPFQLVKIIKILETYGWLLNESECICLSKILNETCLNLMWFMVRMIEFQIYSFVHVTINLKISIIFGVA